MAFPAIPTGGNVTSGQVTSNSTTWTATWPSGVTNDDMVIFVAAIDGASEFFTVTGFTNSPLLSSVSDGSVSLHAQYTVNMGTPSGSVNLNISSAEQGSWYIFRIPIAEVFAQDSTGHAAGGDATGSDTAPDPATFNPPGWGTEDTLWLALAAADRDAAFTTEPSGWSTVEAFASGGANGASLGISWLQSAVASIDPGAFTLDKTEGWAAGVIAIRPAAATDRVPYFRPYSQLLAR